MAIIQWIHILILIPGLHIFLDILLMKHWYMLISDHWHEEIWVRNHKKVKGALICSGKVVGALALLQQIYLIIHCSAHARGTGSSGQRYFFWFSASSKVFLFYLEIQGDRKWHMLQAGLSTSWQVLLWAC